MAQVIKNPPANAGDMGSIRKSLIMQLLRDNLTLWTSDSAGEECDAAEGAEN